MELTKKHGVTLWNKTQSFPGFTLFSPMLMTKAQLQGRQESKVYLIDMNGRIVHNWTVPGMLRFHAELLEDGNLSCTVNDCEHGPDAYFPDQVDKLFNGNTIICEGTTGRLFEVTPEKEVVWEYISPFYSEARFRWGKNNSIYRCMKYEPDYPGLQGHVFDLGKCDKLNRLYGPDAFDVHS